MDLLQKYWNKEYLTEKHLNGFDNYKVSLICFFFFFVRSFRLLKKYIPSDTYFALFCEW